MEFFNLRLENTFEQRCFLLNFNLPSETAAPVYYEGELSYILREGVKLKERSCSRGSRAHTFF